MAGGMVRLRLGRRLWVTSRRLANCPTQCVSSSLSLSLCVCVSFGACEGAGVSECVELRRHLGVFLFTTIHNRCIAAQIYPEDWALATPMADMSLTAGAGRTYKWFGYKNTSGATAPTFSFGRGFSYTSFTVAVNVNTSMPLSGTCHGEN